MRTIIAAVISMALTAGAGAQQDELETAFLQCQSQKLAPQIIPPEPGKAGRLAPPAYPPEWANCHKIDAAYHEREAPRRRTAEDARRLELAEQAREKQIREREQLKKIDDLARKLPK